MIVELTGKYSGKKILVNLAQVQTIGTGNAKETIICFGKDPADELTVQETYSEIKRLAGEHNAESTTS